MIHRCENPGHWAYKYYGAAGIKVCERWHDSRLFFEDIEREIGPRPEGKTLDRLRSNGDYEPGNVRWATDSEQRCNRRDFDADRARKVILLRKTGATPAAIARATGLKYDVVKRIAGHWDRGGYQGLGIAR